MAKRVTTLQLDSRSIRKYVEENFSLEHMVSQYISLYRELQNAIPGKAA
jgi:glycosyltransferase involved in cell wall biosynthesis